MSKGVWLGTRQRVYLRDGYRCRYCEKLCVDMKGRMGRKMADVATVDHVVPRSRGGAGSYDNLVTACFTCNTQKHRRTADEYQAWLAQKSVTA